MTVCDGRPMLRFMERFVMPDQEQARSKGGNAIRFALRESETEVALAAIADSNTTIIISHFFIGDNPLAVPSLQSLPHPGHRLLAYP